MINLDDNIKSVSTSTIPELLDTLSPYEEVNEKAIDLLNINLHIKPIGLFYYCQAIHECAIFNDKFDLITITDKD